MGLEGGREGKEGTLMFWGCVSDGFGEDIVGDYSFLVNRHFSEKSVFILFYCLLFFDGVEKGTT